MVKVGKIFQKLVRSGKIRNGGISTFRAQKTTLKKSLKFTFLSSKCANTPLSFITHSFLKLPEGYWFCFTYLGIFSINKDLFVSYIGDEEIWKLMLNLFRYFYLAWRNYQSEYLIFKGFVAPLNIMHVSIKILGKYLSKKFIWIYFG